MTAILAQFGTQSKKVLEAITKSNEVLTKGLDGIYA